MEENILIKIIISIILVFGGMLVPTYFTGLVVGYIVTRILFSEED